MPKAGRFHYLEPGTDPISARAADLLACPPHLLDKDCLFFQPGLDRVPLGTDARHYVHCRKGLVTCGLRLRGAVSDKVRDELCFILERCGIRTVEYNSRRTRGAGLYRWQCQNGCRQSYTRVTKWRRADVPGQL